MKEDNNYVERRERKIYSRHYKIYDIEIEKYSLFCFENNMNHKTGDIELSYKLNSADSNFY